MSTADTLLNRLFEDHLDLIGKVRDQLRPEILAAAESLVESLGAGGKVLVCGNGGSAADAQHFAAELVGRFGREGEALPAIALTVDSSILTALGNDRGFTSIFSTQIEALGREGDVLIAISTSGRSANVLRAVEVARARRLRVVVLTGSDTGSGVIDGDVTIRIPSRETQRIQEAHALALHAIGELVVQN